MAPRRAKYIQVLGDRLPYNMFKMLVAKLNLPEQALNFYDTNPGQSVDFGNLLLVREELCTDLYCDGEYGPGFKERVKPMDTSLFRKYGLYVEMPYPKARKKLLN